MKNPDMKDSSHHQRNMDKWDDIICWDGISRADFSHLERLPNFHWMRQRSSSVCNPTSLKTGWMCYVSFREGSKFEACPKKISSANHWITAKVRPKKLQECVFLPRVPLK